MYTKPEYKSAYANYLFSLGSDNNVQRFPDGQETINNNTLLSTIDIQRFINECKTGDVNEVILKVNFHDLSGSVSAYQMITAAGIDIPWIESSNEPYMGKNIAWDWDNNMVLVNRAKWRFLWWKIFDNNKYFKLLAQRYAQRTNDVVKYFFEQIQIDVSQKISLAMPFPKSNTHKYKVFYIEVLRWVNDFGCITYHCYGNPDDRGEFNKEKEAVATYHPLGKAKMFSEWAPIHWGLNGNTDHTEHFMKPLQKEMEEERLVWFEDIGATHALKHKGIGFDQNRLFSEFCFVESQGDYIIRKLT